MIGAFKGKKNLKGAIPSPVRWTLFFAACSYSIYFGLCLGGELIESRVDIGFMAVWFVGFLLAVGRWGKPKKDTHGAFVLVLPLCLVLAWIGSSLDLQQAYQDCADRSDQLRADLVGYRQQHKGYPPTLDELGWARLPGKRLIGGSILHYQAEVDRFQLYFSPRTRPGRWNSCSVPRSK